MLTLPWAWLTVCKYAPHAGVCAAPPPTGYSAPGRVLAGGGAVEGEEEAGGLRHHLIRLSRAERPLSVPGQQQPFLLSRRGTQRFHCECTAGVDLRRHIMHSKTHTYTLTHVCLYSHIHLPQGAVFKTVFCLGFVVVPWGLPVLKHICVYFYVLCSVFREF